MGETGVTGQTSIARKLRKRPTAAERVLWNHLRLKQLDGLKFRRQEPIDGYVADFVCYESKIIIELTAGSTINRKLTPKETLISSRKGNSSCCGSGIPIF
jgi:very-short-patch-repair endonuclease